MANSYFQFKQFRIEQSLCAMKVGTDGVLLGAWASVDGADSCLDIGTGTGLLALMVTQRNPKLSVVAIDLDSDAVLQAKENVYASPWLDRISVLHSDVKLFSPDWRFDRIVCNPPYFCNSLVSPDAKRTMARHTSELEFKDLLSSVKRLISSNGLFSVVLPYDVGEGFIKLAECESLYCLRLCRVIPKPGASPKRVLLEFSTKMQECSFNELIIESGGRHCYSEEYKQLTKDFYLGSC